MKKKLFAQHYLEGKATDVTIIMRMLMVYVRYDGLKRVKSRQLSYNKK